MVGWGVKFLILKLMLDFQHTISKLYLSYNNNMKNIGQNPENKSTQHTCKMAKKERKNKINDFIPCLIIYH